MHWLISHIVLSFSKGCCTNDGRCVLQVDTAALRLRDSILTSAETEGLTYQAYWLSTTLALGAFLKASPFSM